MDFEDGILRPVWILSDGILSRRGKLRRDSEIEPKPGPSRLRLADDATFRMKIKTDQNVMISFQS